jgi:hypothetical protein
MNRRPRDIDEHVAANAAAIESEAQEYAANYGCSIEEARQDVIDEYRAGWFADREDAQYEPRDEPIDHAYNEGDREDRYGRRDRE